MIQIREKLPLTDRVAGGTPESPRDVQPNAVSNALVRGLALSGPTACLRLKFGGYLALPYHTLGASRPSVGGI